MASQRPATTNQMMLPMVEGAPASRRDDGLAAEGPQRVGGDPEGRDAERDRDDEDEADEPGDDVAERHPEAGEHQPDDVEEGRHLQQCAAGRASRRQRVVPRARTPGRVGRGDPAHRADESGGTSHTHYRCRVSDETRRPASPRPRPRPSSRVPTFADLGLGDAVLQGRCATSATRTPRPSRPQTIPPLLAGHDLVGLAQTGTGKTAAFALPILDRLDLRQKSAAGARARADPRARAPGLRGLPEVRLPHQGRARAARLRRPGLRRPAQRAAPRRPHRRRHPRPDHGPPREGHPRPHAS